MLDARTDALHEQAHGLAGDLNEAFHPQDIVRTGGFGDAFDELLRRRERRHVYNEGVEILVVVLALKVVMRRPALEIGFRRRTEPEQHRHRHLAVLDFHDFHGLGQRLADIPGHRFQLGRRHQVGLVQDHEIGAQELILVDLFQRIVVIERIVLGALAGDRLGVIGKPAGRHGSAIDDGHDAVDRDARGDFGPVEGLDQRFGQREPRGLDDNVLGRIGAVEQAHQRRHEIVGYGAADAAVRQLDDAVFGAAFDAAALQDVAVDADVAEFVDDHREAPSVGIFEDVADQRGLSRTEKPGDDRARHLGQGSHD